MSMTRLPQLGVLVIDGPDAAGFLQGQATCDTRSLDSDRGTLGALCNLQGRMIVSFQAFSTPQGLQLVVPRDRIAAVLAHLAKYAVFAKVALRDGSNEYAAAWPGDADASLRVRAASRASVLPDDDGAWLAASIGAGRLLVDSANADRFLPQALNYDLVDGVSFRKGCYTGQEIVARMHFKGKMKERLHAARAHMASPPPANSVILDAAGNRVGEVVASVADGQHSVLAGAVIRRDAAAAGGLRLADGDVALAIVALPYALPDDQ